MNSTKSRVLKRTVRFTLASLIGNSFMAFLVYKLIAKTNPKISGVNLTLLAALVILITAIEAIVFWSNLQNIFERQHLFQTKLEEILRGHKPEKIRLDPNDSFYELAKTVNEVSAHDRHQIHVLSNQENELEAIVDNLPVGVLVINRHRELQVANSYAVENLKITSLDVPHPFTMDVKNSDFIELVERTFTEHKTYTGLINFGEEFDRVFETTVVYSPQVHHKFEVIVLMYDVTESIRMKKMEKDFINNASHELRTPITSISGFAETLLDGAKDDPEKLNQFLTIIKTESDKLVGLTNDILTMSKISDRGEDLKDVNLKDYVDNQIQFMQSEIERRNLIVDNNIPADMVKKVNENDLFQIVKNLLTNAIEYNHDGGQVIFEYRESKRHWKLIVRDTGIGIPEDQREFIFDRFYRVDTSRSRTKMGGTGLGLAIVQEAAKHMGGKAIVDSNEDHGTTFIVRLPMEN